MHWAFSRYPLRVKTPAHTSSMASIRRAASVTRQTLSGQGAALWQAERMDAYTAGFFETQVVESRQSAEHVVPLLIELFPEVATVLDVGGGAGAWTATW